MRISPAHTAPLGAPIRTPTKTPPTGTPTLRLCPACTRRNPAHELVNPHCPICDGRGTLTLGAAGLHHYPAEVIAEAILLALEAQCSRADQEQSLSDHRVQTIFDTLDQLRSTGILDNTNPLPAALLTPRRDSTDPAPLLAAGIIQDSIPGIDRVLATAPRYQYQGHERPRQRGLPVLSRHGHPSALARITDPADPRGSTQADHNHNQATTHQAQVLIQSVKRTWRTALREAEETMDALPIPV